MNEQNGQEILHRLYEIIDELDADSDPNADVLRQYVGQVADEFYPVDCAACVYGARDTRGGIVCANYGPEEHRPMGHCQSFEVGKFGDDEQGGAQ